MGHYLVSDNDCACVDGVEKLVGVCKFGIDKV